MNQTTAADAGAVFRPRSRLGRRMALILLPMVLIPVVIIGGVGFLRSRDILAQQASDQLTSAASAQVNQLLDWSETRQERMQLGSQRSSIREPLAHLLYDNPSPSQQTTYRETLQAEFDDLRSSEGLVLFSHLFAVDPNSGTILASTNPAWEGRQITGELEDHVSMHAGETHPLYDAQLISPGKMSIISSTPMRTGMMEEIDVVLVGVNLETRVGALMESLQAFSQQRGVFREQTGQTFMFTEPNIIMQLPRYSMAPEATVNSNHPVFNLINQAETGSEQYVGFNGAEVLGAYEWVPDLGIGVVVEVPTETVFAELNSLLPFIATLVVVTAVLSMLLVIFATSRMLQPLGRLAEFAQRISRGDWSYRVQRTRQDEIGVVGNALNRMAEELQQSYQTLERRVQERTQQVRTASEVARAVTSIPSLEDLLRQAVELISARFDYYHVSIFLIDREGRNAVLRQATGEIGQALLARRHKLAVGSESIIGWVTANNEARVASTVTDDPVHFRNELLPETKAEAAVPLQVGGTVLGALDVQSTEAEAFSPEDIEILQTLADQLSAAIQNARLAETSVAAAERARMISDVTTQMSGLLDVDQVLSTAAQSLHQALGDSEIMIKLTVPGTGEVTDGN